MKSFRFRGRHGKVELAINPRRLLGASVTVHDGGGEDMTFHLCLWPVSIWLSPSLPVVVDRWVRARMRDGCRCVGVSLWRDVDAGGGTLMLQWHAWADPHCWSTETPRWRDGMVDLLDVIFGKVRYSIRTVERVEDAAIHMPEGAYEATIEIADSTWKRPRWPFSQTVRRAHVDIPQGIPHEGKGGALFGSGFPCGSVRKAVAKVVTDVLMDRDPRRLGSYPSPSERAASSCAATVGSA